VSRSWQNTSLKKAEHSCRSGIVEDQFHFQVEQVGRLEEYGFLDLSGMGLE
jgi:hypothetical protein